MQKKLVFIMIGIIIGGVGVSIFWAKVIFYNKQRAKLENLVQCEELAFKVYQTGEINSSLISLNFIIDKLESYKKTLDPQSTNYNIFINDLGLTYGRLFVVYNRIYQQEKSEHAYQKAVELIGSKCNISSRKELNEVIKKIDKSAQNSR